jgi:hypothetical protein
MDFYILEVFCDFEPTDSHQFGRQHGNRQVWTDFFARVER